MNVWRLGRSIEYQFVIEVYTIKSESSSFIEWRWTSRECLEIRKIDRLTHFNNIILDRMIFFVSLNELELVENVFNWGRSENYIMKSNDYYQEWD